MVKFTTSDFFTQGLWSHRDTAPMLRLMDERSFEPTHIRHFRREKRLTLEKLAELVDMTPSHLSMLERGLRGYTQETLEAISDALDVPLDLLVKRDPEAPEGIREVWLKASAAQRRQIVELAKALLRTGTDD